MLSPLRVRRLGGWTGRPHSPGLGAPILVREAGSGGRACRSRRVGRCVSDDPGPAGLPDASPTLAGPAALGPACDLRPDQPLALNGKAAAQARAALASEWTLSNAVAGMCGRGRDLWPQRGHVAVTPTRSLTCPCSTERAPLLSSTDLWPTLPASESQLGTRAGPARGLQSSLVDRSGFRTSLGPGTGPGLDGRVRTWRLGSHVPLCGGHNHSQSLHSSIFLLRPMMACHQRQRAKDRRGKLGKDRAGAASRLEITVPRRARPSGPAPACPATVPLPCESRRGCPMDGAATMSRRSRTSSRRMPGPPEQAPRDCREPPFPHRGGWLWRPRGRHTPSWPAHGTGPICLLCPWAQ